MTQRNGSTNPSNRSSNRPSPSTTIKQTNTTQLHDRNRIITPITFDSKPANLLLNELVSHYVTDPVYNKQLTSILTSTNDREHRGFYIDVIRLITGQTISLSSNQFSGLTSTETSAALAHILIGQPSKFIELSDDAIFQAQELWKAQLEASSHSKNHNVELSIKPRHLLHSRPFNLPLLCSRQSINLIRSADVDCLIDIRGSIGRASSSRVYEFGLKYRCAKCESEFFAYADETQENRISVPLKCGANSSSSSKQCRSTHIEPVMSNDSTVPRDIQTAKLQQTAQRGAINQSINQSITLVFKDELVEKAKPGDEVAVVGVVRRQWASCLKEARIVVELYLDVMQIEVLSSIGRNDCDSSVNPAVGNGSLGEQNDFGSYWLVHGSKHALAARDFIISSFAPSLFGMYVPKLAALLCVIGGCTEEISQSNTNQPVNNPQFNSGYTQATQVESEDHSGGTRNSLRIRGDIHCLFVGDPGTGKSQLLQFASLLSRRGIFTTGAGSTSAGLTVAAVREKRKRYDSASGSSEGGWILEPGALVLADGGVCCIDEFNGIAKADRLAIHEAMEQQTISVAKAGLVTTLHSRTAIIAALNPKGGDFDADADLTVNTALGSPLLSRFDLILVLLDTRKEEWDEKIAHYILKSLPTESDYVKKQELNDEDEDEEERQQNEANQALAVMARQQSSVNQSNSQLANQNIPSAPDGIRRNYDEVRGRTMSWSAARLRSYVAHVRERTPPALSRMCEILLKRYYQHQRRSDARKQARVTVRLLESLVRITQAHARLMYRTRCIAQDAIVAIFLMENTISSCGLLTQMPNASIWSSATLNTSALHVDFSDTPDLQYLQWENVICLRLGVDPDELKSDEEMYLYQMQGDSDTISQPIIQTQNTEPFYMSVRSQNGQSQSQSNQPFGSQANSQSNSRSSNRSEHSDSLAGKRSIPSPNHSALVSPHPLAVPLPPPQPAHSSQSVDRLSQTARGGQLRNIPNDRMPGASVVSVKPSIVSTQSSQVSSQQASPLDQARSVSVKQQKDTSGSYVNDSSSTASVPRLSSHNQNATSTASPVSRYDSAFELPDDFDDEVQVRRPPPRAPSFNPFLNVSSSAQPHNSSRSQSSVQEHNIALSSSQHSLSDDIKTQATQTVYPLPPVIPLTTPRIDDFVPPPPPRTTVASVQPLLRSDRLAQIGAQVTVLNRTVASNQPATSLLTHSNNVLAQVVVSAPKVHPITDNIHHASTDKNVVNHPSRPAIDVSSFRTPLKQVSQTHGRSARSPTTNTPPPLSAATASSRVGQLVPLDADFRSIFNGKPFSNNPFDIAAALQTHAAAAQSESTSRRTGNEANEMKEITEVIQQGDNLHVVSDDIGDFPKVPLHHNSQVHVSPPQVVPHQPSVPVIDVRSLSESEDPFMLDSPKSSTVIPPRGNWMSDIKNEDDLDMSL